MPREVNPYVKELQEMLLADDCYLPWAVQEYSDLTKEAKLVASQGNPEPVRDGINRPVGEHSHCWTCGKGDHLAYVFNGRKKVEHVTLILDSALDKIVAMSHHQRDDQLTHVPDVMPKAFRIEALEGSEWHTMFRVHNNYQRLVRLTIGKELDGLRFVLDKTWGNKTSRVYAFYLS